MHNDPLLSEQEFDELDRFLMSDQCNDDAMTMDALHGFLTAIAIGPEKIPASEWLAAVWGTDPEETPAFDSPQAEQRIAHLMTRTLEDIEVTLAEIESGALRSYQTPIDQRFGLDHTT